MTTMRYKLFPSTDGRDLVMVDFETNTAQIMPRYLSWSALGTLPLEVSRPLNQWSNEVEYLESSYLQHSNLNETLPDWVGGMVESLGITREERILDFGTGTGAMRLALLRDGYLETVGVDVSADCLDRQALSAVQLKLSVSGEEKRNLLTLAKLESGMEDYAGSFSLIILHSALHHFADLRGFFRLCHALLRPGGKVLALSEPINKQKYHVLSGNSEAVVDLLEVTRMMDRKEKRKTSSSLFLAEFWDGVGFNRSEMTRILEETGFRLALWEPSSWLSYIFHHIVRNNLNEKDDPAPMAVFENLYSQALSLEKEINQIVTEQFKIDNYFTVTILAERPL